jgi:hypothetical protein
MARHEVDNFALLFLLFVHHTGTDTWQRQHPRARADDALYRLARLAFYRYRWSRPIDLWCETPWCQYCMARKVDTYFDSG